MSADREYDDPLHDERDERRLHYPEDAFVTDVEELDRLSQGEIAELYKPDWMK